MERKSNDPEAKKRYKSLSNSIKMIERTRPVRMPILMRMALGNVNLLLPERDRLRYKAAYEHHKLFWTMISFSINLVQLLIWPHSTLLAALSNLILLYAYSTLTMREYVLQLNGSAIKGWWTIHHLLSILLSICLLLWPEGQTYQIVRAPLLLFRVYTAALQYLQYRYQMGRLYTLRALSRVHPMQTTTESASAHLFNGIAFLLPFVLLGNAAQFWVSYILYVAVCSCEWNEWQPISAMFLFFGLASGNLSTTLLTVWHKWHKPAAAIAGGPSSGIYYRSNSTIAFRLSNTC